MQAVADELGAPHFAVECDVQSVDSIRAAFAEIAKRHQKIDVLINNAAVYEPFFVKDATDDQILAPILTNFAGPVFTSRAAIPMMEKGGYIINVTSESVALEFPLLSMYQSSKAGLERFSQSLSKELEPDGIRVSVVRCGPMMEEGKGSNWDMEVTMQFYQLCVAAGIDMINAASRMSTTSPACSARCSICPAMSASPMSRSKAALPDPPKRTERTWRRCIRELRQWQAKKSA